MPIRYALFENHLTADPDDYAAIVQTSGSADGDDLVQDIIDQGSTVGRPDILAVTAALKLACQRRVEQGQRVNYFGMMDFFPRIKGIFNGATDSFDPARHSIDVGANPGAELREAVKTEASVEKVEAVKPAPNPVEYYDIASSSTNDVVTPGNIGQLSGNRLKFDPAEADEGLYFGLFRFQVQTPAFLVRWPSEAVGFPAFRRPRRAIVHLETEEPYFVATAGGETKVTTVQKNKPSQQVFLVPAALAAGTYHLEVRARMDRGTSAREFRIGRLDATLTAIPT